MSARGRSTSNIPFQQQAYSHPIFQLDYDDIKRPSFFTRLVRGRRTIRSRQYLLAIILVLVTVFALLFFQPSFLAERWRDNSKPSVALRQGGTPPPSTHKPSPPAVGSSHPIWQLVRDNEKEWEGKLARQSKTLSAAVAEYKRRYGIPPPPYFDKWYQFARAKKVQLIDEYDSIQQTLTPFWGLKPSTIRARARETIGFDGNNVIGVLIRNGAVKKIAGGGEWQMEATKGMLEGFIQHLPDMDLAFNIHDEPRVLVPYDDLSRLVALANNFNKPTANSITEPRNSWSSKPADLSDGSRFEDIRTTRFNVFAHQPTWTHCRMSCPPDSPARVIEDGAKEDNFDNYALGELGFVYNQTAFSDICQSPSFSETYGFFDRPNAFNVVHDLMPIFSQSKVSSFNDILYPSPWYWYGKVPYNNSSDYDWDKKADKMYWRGSTTGGFSRDGGWRRQHRQHMVQKINANGMAKILVNRGEETRDDWHIKEVPRSDFKELFDVYFSHIGQCDPGDCDVQKQFFKIKSKARQDDAWKYKYLLDIDGNAFSGRFYAFLKSKSLVYKLAVFREWHEEWIKPWIHFIPLSLRGDEWIEAVRWFAGEAPGKKEAERIALQGREWADKVLRNEDLEVWFFRLLLEYGRLVDDSRNAIGYTG